jgi:two-component system response regulator FixJ
MDGLEVQRELRARGITLPVVIMTGHGDVDMAVAAMKAGASDFIEKPFEKVALLACIEAAKTLSLAERGAMARAEEARARLNILTDRERDVLDGLVQGLPNKSIAYDLGISPRTVEIHRANLMQKLEAKSLAEALRIAFHAG